MAQELHNDGDLIFQSFQSWGKYHPIYKKFYKNLSSNILLIIKTGFNEMILKNNAGFEIWWAANHPKFIKESRQKEITFMFEIVFKFLEDYRQGRVGKIIEESKKNQTDGKRNRKQKVSEENQTLS